MPRDVGNPDAQPAGRCASCGADLHGLYCSRCGEKRLHPAHDLSLRHFIEESVEGFFHVDSRFWRTLVALVASPGLLTAEFVSGRRVGYMKPLPLFLGVALAFYLLFPTVTAFYANPGNLIRGYRNGNLFSNTFRIDPSRLLGSAAVGTESDVEARALSVARAHAAPASKSWLFAIVPVWAFSLWTILRWRQRWLVPHVVFALHGMAVFMILDVIGLAVAAGIFRMRSLGDTYVWLLISMMTVWCVLAVHRAYRVSRITAIPIGMAVSGLFFVLLALYRQLVTLWALWVHPG